MRARVLFCRNQAKAKKKNITKNVEKKPQHLKENQTLEASTLIKVVLATGIANKISCDFFSFIFVYMFILCGTFKRKRLKKQSHREDWSEKPTEMDHVHISTVLHKNDNIQHGILNELKPCLRLSETDHHNSLSHVKYRDIAMAPNQQHSVMS